MRMLQTFRAAVLLLRTEDVVDSICLERLILLQHPIGPHTILVGGSGGSVSIAKEYHAGRRKSKP